MGESNGRNVMMGTRYALSLGVYVKPVMRMLSTKLPKRT